MISTENVCVAYHGRTVLSDVSVAAKPGQVLGLVGPSGCGKSSFLSALNRMTDLIPGASVSGSIQFAGQAIDRVFLTPSELRRQVGMIFQRPNPFPMSIRRNIELALREHGQVNRKELNRITESVLRDVGLWDEVHDRLDHSALQLSGGQQQRLCIARALALQPQVLLMDEPCSALDPLSTRTIEQLIQSMRGQLTVIIVTHNLAQARRLTDTMAVFWTRDGIGRVVELGETETLFESPSNEFCKAYLSGQAG